MKALLLSALAAALLVFASSANAATATVRISNLATRGELLTATSSGIVGMRAPGAPGQVWAKADLAPGFVASSALEVLAPRVQLGPVTGPKNQRWVQKAA